MHPVSLIRAFAVHSVEAKYQSHLHLESDDSEQIFQLFLTWAHVRDICPDTAKVMFHNTWGNNPDSDLQSSGLDLLLRQSENSRLAKLQIIGAVKDNSKIILLISE